MSYPDLNQIGPELREKLRGFTWNPNNFLDLHSLGVHYWTPDYLPAWLDPLTYASLWRRGLTPPNALPIATPADTQQRITTYINENYHKLTLAGLPYLGNEFNLQRPEEFDEKPVRICFVRISSYATLDGAFGGFLINNFMQDFSDEIFADFAWIPETPDVARFMQAGLPTLFGTITKRPLTDFDIIIMATSYPGERVNAPNALVRSGIPMYRWERFDESLPYYEKMPLITCAGIGASFIENLLADHPIKGVGENSLFDHILIGEGEVMDFKYVIDFLNVKRDGGTKKDFVESISNENHQGVYDPRRVLFEYADKIHTFKDFNGTELSTQTYPGAGHIKRVSMIDHEAQTRHVIAGPESEEFIEMEPVARQYRSRFAPGVSPDELGEHYVKISDKQTLAQRLAGGMKDDRKLSTGKLAGIPVVVQND